MADDDRDVGGHSKRVLGFERPSLLEDLKNIMHEYPDNEHIFKMPGLCVYNDALFTEEDWQGIRKIHASVKVKDPLKVGKFGLGFKSVFHLTAYARIACLCHFCCIPTDHPIIISGPHLLFMDPFREEREAIYMTSLDDLDREEWNTLGGALKPLLHLLDKDSLGDKNFKGTVFWFPLRQTPSELSQTVYSQQRVQQLKQAFRGEISTMLLFLKRLERVEVFSAHSESQSPAPTLDFSVELSGGCVAAVRASREKFLSGITTRDRLCPQQEVVVSSHLVVKVVRAVAGGVERDEEHWLVVHYHQGTYDMSSQLTFLCQRKYLTHRPYVGVAAKLNSPAEAFQGQLFCFLPLPPETPSPTGLPVHVHGFFELSQNRRHVEWPKGEGEEGEPNDEAALWNSLLVREVLPRAYVTLLTELVNSAGTGASLFTSKTSPEQTVAMTADVLYQLCPNHSKLTTHWQPLLAPFYRKLSTSRLFFTQLQGGYWVSLHEAVVMTSPTHDGLDEDTEVAVVEVYAVCRVNLVRLPRHVLHGMNEVSATSVTCVSPQHLSDLMQADTTWSGKLFSDQKCLILRYLCRHGDQPMLQGLELLPLADGSFCTPDDHVVHVCRDDQDLSLFLGLPDRLCHVTQPDGLQQCLQGLAESGFGNLRLLTDDTVLSLLADSLATQHSGRSDITVSREDPWIRQVWLYLNEKDLQDFDHLPLLPCPHGNDLILRPLQGTYLCERERLDGFPPTSSALSQALRHLGVHVIPSLPDFVLRHSDVIHSRVQPASRLGVLKCLARLAEEDKRTVQRAVVKFNTESDVDAKLALVDILAEGKSRSEEDEKHEWEAAKSVLTNLRLFPVWSACVASTAKAKVPSVKTGKTKNIKGRRESLKHPSGEYTSVQENGHMTPDVSSHALLPPAIKCSPKLLYCDITAHRQIARQLGAREMTLEDLVGKTLADLPHCSDPGSAADATVFVTYFLQSSLFENTSLQNLARAIRFVPSCVREELHKAADLYDPEDNMLQDLFAGEDRFPARLFLQGKGALLQNLKVLGLRSSAKVTAQHLIQTATKIEELCRSERSEDIVTAQRKARAMLTFIQKHGHSLTTDTVQQLATLQCLPCVTSRDHAPPGFPAALPVCPAQHHDLGISRAVDMCHYDKLELVGSVKPVLLARLSPDCSISSYFYQPTADDVINQLNIVISMFNKKQSQQFATILLRIYSELNAMYRDGVRVVTEKLKDMKCILTEKDGCFRLPGKFWIADEDTDDLDLSPYCFPLPSALVDAGLDELFAACGCHQGQGCGVLTEVLQEIQTKHAQLSCDKKAFNKDLKLVKKILQAIVNKGEYNQEEILLPIDSARPTELRFAKARDCTVAPDPNEIELLAEEEEGTTLVHPDLDKDVALTLGALDLRGRIVAEMADLEIDESELGDSEYGQNETLTTRLHNLLREGYTDGFSVPKELVQNADDARASVVKFLVDERDNGDWRSGLLTPALADLQGPALWVYNDSVFTRTDFDNLCKLGGATKKQDCSKVGKFGLGFNAVYNVTEVPSIYSGSTLAMLDPHQLYLDNKRGKKMDFGDIMNKVLLRRMPNQFRPFQGVFGCDMLNKDWKPFSGTLFRFPFRTEGQAEKSEICQEAFTAERREDFMEGLMSKAGNLLLFLQHVKRVELYRLPRDCSDPAQAQRLMVVTRNSVPTVPRQLSGNESILEHFSKAWESAVEHGQSFHEQNLTETVTVSMEAEKTDKREGETTQSKFRIAWTPGAGESCDTARETSKEGFVPLAAVAILTDNDGRIMPIESCPEGFYTTGHLFCFLPLARQVSLTDLPLHINAPFALTSDRRGLLSQNEDEKKLIEGRWNKALFSDPIPRAYLAALESVAPTQTSAEPYYSLWPQHTAQPLREGQSPQGELYPHFYQLLVQEHFKVFLHPSGCTGFSDSFFFDPELSDTDIGRVAFRVLETFWEESEWHAGRLIDLPPGVADSISRSGQGVAFRQRVITIEQFCRCVLFPKVDQGHTALEAGDRDRLVLYALQSHNAALHELVQSHACIPCRPDGRLRAPASLVHPHGLAAPLFSEDDAMFPQREVKADFTTNTALSQLLKLGMVKDTVSREELRQRAESVGTLPETTALQRAKAVIKYLPDLGKEMKSNVAVLRNIRFLPVLKRPKGWPLMWAGQGKRFTAPFETFASSLKELVGCQAAVLNEVPLDLSGTDRETLGLLGVTQYKSMSLGNTRLTEVTVTQLMSIAEDPNAVSQSNYQAVATICKEIYQYLDSFCRRDPRGTYKDHRLVIEGLKERQVVLTGQGFQEAGRLAMGPRNDLEPYLTYADGYTWRCHELFAFLGVKAAFGVSDILDAMRQLASDHSESQCDSKLVDLLLKMAELLEATLRSEKREHLKEEETSDLYLPDRDGGLRPISELCLNDCDWLEESDTMHFLHPKFSEHLALTLGVRTKREHDEVEFSESFGQHEKLTNRINRLLEGYTRDASIFKELLQNADDAGATEVRFVKDLRNHRTEKLLNEKWKEMFGPALCIFNDASFTPRDMKGIQDLGEGSKEGEPMKTGKYGVGFNAVYNLTDTPCFWTRVVPEPVDTAQVEEKKLGEKLCVMDPNFFVASPRARRPGQQLSVTDRFRAQYSNMLSPFMLEAKSTEAQSGTVFRLPLRTEDKASKTKIRQPAATMEEVNDLLQDFRSTMGECLLFLNNVKKIGVYTAKEDGTIELDFETQLTADERNMKMQEEFKLHVKSEAERLKDEASCPSLGEFLSREVSLHCKLCSSDGGSEEWLVVHRVGLSNSDNVPDTLQLSSTVRKHKMLPVGGVAVCLSMLEEGHTRYFSSQRIEGTGTVKTLAACFEGKHDGNTPVPEVLGNLQKLSASAQAADQRTFQAFCTLPIPVNTGLPVHVNGRFALDHETRRNIYNGNDHELTSWNELLTGSVIVPAYVTALREVRRLCFSQEEVSLGKNDKQKEESDALPDTGHNSGKKRKKKKKHHDEKTACLNKASLVSSADVNAKLEQYSNFFPDHRVQVDTFWKSLMTSFYQHLAETEADVFPVLRRDWDHLLWVPALRSEGFPGYFLRDALSSSLKQVLMNLNMNIVECPFWLHEAFVKSSVEGIKVVDDETVVDFLQSCHRDDSDTDSCNLKDLPEPVEDTGFKTAEGVHVIFTFIKKQDRDLEGLPLSLRMSGQLHCFTPHNPIIVSKFYDLLPGSSGLFLHSKLIPCVILSKESPLPEYLKHFDLAVLAQKLPFTLHESMMNRGLTQSLGELSSKHKDICLSDWIKRLWCFLNELENNELDIELLQEWCLIPAVKDGTVYLFPIIDRNRVVYIPTLTIQQVPRVVNIENEDVNRSLDKLPLFKLDTGLVSCTHIATQTVASVNNPTDLITALTNLQEHNLNSNEAEVILDFFFRTVDCQSLASRVLLLPFFETPDGSFVALGNNNRSLCLPDDIPHDGLKEWSNNRGISLVKRNGRLEQLFVQLGIASPDREEFYCGHLLPTLSSLPADTIPKHIEFIKDSLHCKDDKRLLRTMRRTPFIKGTDGTLSTASHFFSPYCEVFKVMMPQERFPPPPYDDDKWRSFLLRVGMVCEVSEKWFLTFAREVADNAGRPLSEKLQQQSKELVLYLKSSEKLRSDQFLEQLKGVKFLVPLSHDDLPDGKLLQSFHPLFHPPTPLISFSEGLAPDKKYLGWTSSCLLSPDANPSQFVKWKHNMHDFVGFNPQPSEDLVVRHVKNVCQSLGMKDKGGSSLLTLFDDRKLNLIEEIMKAIYNHLGKSGPDMLRGIRDVAIIFDKDKKAMFSADQVVITLTEQQVIQGFVTRAPEHLGNFFSLFRRLGVCDTVTPDHYAVALERIHDIYGDHILNLNDLVLVSRAVDNFFTFLKGELETTSFSRSNLYLPAKNMCLLTMYPERILQVRLMDSKTVVVDVKIRHQKRLKTEVEGLLVFVNFALLGLKNHNLHEEVKLLPHSCRMKEWHEVVKEVLLESCRREATQDSDTRSITKLLHSADLAHVVKRLKNHKLVQTGEKLEEDEGKRIEDALKHMAVFKTQDLRTVLVLHGSELPDSSEEKTFFIFEERQRNLSDSETAAKVSLYMDTNQEVGTDNVRIKKNIRFLRKAIYKAVGFDIAADLDDCLADLSAASEIMDEADITPYSGWQPAESAYPPPGVLIPDTMHFMLDQDVYEFEVGHFVACELNDPLVDVQESKHTITTDDEWSSPQDLQPSTSGEKSAKQKPSYIFCKVKRVIEPETDMNVDTRTRLLLLRYVIVIGENDGEEELKEVQGCELYKFIRPTPVASVPFTGDTAPPLAAFSQPGASDDLKAVLRDIRRQLRSMPDAKSRKQVSKRLILKWHPDKNPGKEKFCTEVFQAIQDYMSRLEQGEELLSDDEDDRSTRASGGDGFGSFFDDVFARGQSYAESRRTFHSSGGWSSPGFSFRSYCSSSANPQPKEGKRWLQQAEKDKETAREMLQRDTASFNWICYMTHQAAEKALKAVLYRRDAGHDQRYSHSICSIACSVRDASTQVLVSQLDDLLGYHTQMRYPGYGRGYPKIPSDIYSQEEAAQACDLADKIVERAKELFDSFRTPPPSPPPPQHAPPPRPTQQAVGGSSHLSVTSSSSERRPAIASHSSQTRALPPPPLKALTPP
ncbi:sacsin-like [Littorina saxatilis]|uniref:sacsin-like n=1 Tax=Littorina saxatilis TaxID=31220 RepID=UPI0038B4B479